MCYSDTWKNNYFNRRNTPHSWITGVNGAGLSWRYIWAGLKRAEEKPYRQRNFSNHPTTHPAFEVAKTVVQYSQHLTTPHSHTWKRPMQVPTAGTRLIPKATLSSLTMSTTWGSIPLGTSLTRDVDASKVIWNEIIVLYGKMNKNMFKNMYLYSLLLGSRIGMIWDN